jgi:ACS family D-galactonate transporter-like MFS transporter
VSGRLLQNRLKTALEQSPVGGAWLHVGLVFSFMVINFADKAVIGLSSGAIMSEMALTNAQFGTLGSAFFLLFSFSGVAGGFLANKIRTKPLMSLMAVLWAVSVLPISLMSSFPLLLGSRLVLGAAEGPAFPIALHSIYKWFPDRQRALPTSVIASGAAFGTGIVAPLISWIIARFGWHAAFGTLGMMSLGWFCLWSATAAEGPLDGVSPSRPEHIARVTYRQLLLSRTAVGVFLAGFAAYSVIALNITWLANYLVKQVHITPIRAGWFIGFVSLMQIMLVPGFAWLSQRLSGLGVSSRVTRGLLGAACVVTGGASMIWMAGIRTGLLQDLLIGLSFSIGAVIFPLGSALIGEITPPLQRGAMLGITNSVHTLAGLVAPVMMGHIIDAYASPATGFRIGFLMNGIMVIAFGTVAAVLIDPQADLVRFARRARSTAAGSKSESKLSEGG